MLVSVKCIPVYTFHNIPWLANGTWAMLGGESGLSFILWLSWQLNLANLYFVIV